MTSYDPFTSLLQKFAQLNVRYVLMGVWAANYYAKHGGHVFATKDRDLLFPLDPENLLKGWHAGGEVGYELWSGQEPLGAPLDLWLAERVIANRAVTTAIHPEGVIVDFSLVMAGFDFDTVWNERRTFRVADVEIPVARLSHIVESKAKANRPKDRLFLATWEEALRKLLKEEE